MNLSQTLLDAARDEIAKKNNFNTWEDYIDDLNEYANRASRIEDAGEEAALLAMEKQAGFFRWASEWYAYSDVMEVWVDKLAIYKHHSELELYEIWEASSS